MKVLYKYIIYKYVSSLDLADLHIDGVRLGYLRNQGPSAILRIVP
jgi:hypothetical protein